MTTQTTQAPTITDEELGELFEQEDLWAVIVWNDDVTTFETVIRAFMDIFGYGAKRSNDLAWKIHRTGKAVVAVRPKAEAQAAVDELHRRKIQASLDRA